MKTNNIRVAAFCIAIGLSTTAYAAKGGGGGGGPSGGNGGNSGMDHGQGGAGNGMNDLPGARPLPDDRSPGTKPAVNPPSTPARSAAPAAKELSDSMHSINQTAFAQRKDLLDSVDMRLQSSRDALKQIQSEAKASRADARADFKAALADVKAREKDLDAAVKASRKADEAGWENRRAELAKANQAYADAVAHLEALPRLPAPPVPALP